MNPSILDWKVLALILSIALNIIQFFKPAINEILVKLWDNRVKKHEKEKEILKKLRNEFKELTRQAFISQLSSLGLKAGYETRSQWEQRSNGWSELHKSILNEDMHYPESIRENIQKYIQLFHDQNARIMDGTATYSDAKDLLLERKPLEDEILKETESEILK